MAHKKSVEQEQARALYREGRNYNEITALLDVAKSSVSLWCSDLARERRAAKTVARIREARIVVERAVKPAPRPRVAVVANAPFGDYNLYTYATQRDRYTRVQLIHRETGERLSMALARYRMSVHLGRVLDTDELVIHRDLNHITEQVEDLIVVNRNDRRGKRDRPAKACIICETEFTPKKKNVETCSSVCRYALVSMLAIDRHRERAQG